MAGKSTHTISKTLYLPALACLLFVALACAAFSFTGIDDFDLARQQILLRKIGHEVLLHSGDSTSRVLPVKKIAKNEYQIKFENDFTFQPDSLVGIIRRSLLKDNLADNYIVNVVKCGSNDVIFGYAIFHNAKDNLIPCSGRKQPKGCYLINLKFESKGITPSQKGYLLAGLPLLAFIGLIVSKSVKTHKKETQAVGVDNNDFKIGNTLFNPNKRQITNAGLITELTAKENKLLLIFAQLPNTVIERGRLQKEIWEDEGVIVGRSLDMFISKLRKKLESDPGIQLINIHGKGYKLATDC
jgi:DNA-binding winged helix-turn-helix (wHTH) protein